MERLLKVGDLARETGKSVRAIHLYEEMGLIQSVARTRGRYRLFSESTLERLSWISNLQASGLSLSQIQELNGAVRGCEAGRDAMCHLRCFYEERLDQIRKNHHRPARDRAGAGRFSPLSGGLPGL